MKLFNNPCVCCDCTNGSKWSKCIGNCPKPSKIKGHNVLTQNGGNLSKNRRLSHKCRTGRYSSACRKKCNGNDWEEKIKIRGRDLHCNFIDRDGTVYAPFPTITMYGGITITDVSNVVFTDPGVIALDHLGDKLIVIRTISPTLNLSNIPYAVGTYKFTYKAEDRFGQETTAERNVTFS